MERASVSRRRQENISGPEVVVGREGEGPSAALLVEICDEVAVRGAEVGLVGGGPERERERERVQ